jgi:hypothetical protein
MTRKSRWQQLKSDAWAARRRGDCERAEALFRAAADEASENNQDLGDLCITLNGLADLYAEQGQTKKAVETAKRIVSLRRRVAASQDILLGNDLMFLAMVLAEQGESHEAIVVAEEGAAIYSAVLGERHPETHRMMSFLAQEREKCPSRQRG